MLQSCVQKKKNHEAIIGDIGKLQFASSVDISQKVLSLFLEKCENQQEEFIEYFKPELD